MSNKKFILFIALLFLIGTLLHSCVTYKKVEVTHKEILDVIAKDSNVKFFKLVRK